MGAAPSRPPLDIRSPEFWIPEYAAPYFGIQPKRGGLVRFNLNHEQLVLSDLMRRCYAEQKNPLHLKARRVGSSTLFSFVLYQHTAYRPHVKSSILGNKGETTKELMDMVLTYWESAPKYLQPSKNAKVKSSLDLPMIHSKMDSQTVRSADPLRSGTRQAVLATEIAFWPEVFAAKAWSAVKNACVSPRDGGLLIGESTPNYKGDPMDLEWTDAQTNPDSMWIPCFLPWLAIPEYRMQPPVGWKPGSLVTDYANRYGLDDQQAYWMAMEGLAKCNNDIQTFLREYPPNDIECWLIQGDATFDRDILMEMLAATGGTDISKLETGYAEFPVGSLQLPWKRAYTDWREHRNIVICDPAGSFSTRDMFGVEIMNLMTCEFMAEYYGHTNAYEMARLLIEWAVKFNDADIYVEANGVGDSVLSHLIHTFGYPHVFHRRDARHSKEKKPGWWSNQQRKVEAIGDLDQLVREGSIGIYSTRLLRQLLQYRGQWDKLARDVQGGHFDLVAAAAIGAHTWRRSGYRRRENVTGPKEPPGILTLNRFSKMLHAERFNNTPYGEHR